MKTLNLIIALSAAAALQTSGALIPGLYNTGVNGGGTVLPDAFPGGDPHYKLISVPTGSTTDTRVRTAAGNYPIPPYMADGPLSAWIGPNNDAQINGPSGYYVYRTTFDLTGYNPSTALINGGWAVDDNGLIIIFNGNVIAVGNATNPNYSQFTPFSITAGFLPGVNTLDFAVLNTFVFSPSPTALRVEMRGDVSAVPEPSTYIAGMSALGMLFLFGRKNRK